jgi:L-asparaginase
MDGRPRIKLIALGGTIASTSDQGGREVAPRLTADALAAAVPGLDALATLETTDREPAASFELGPEQMLDVAHVARTAIESGCRGVVVTQGTDTLEETAYLLALTLGRHVPVAITGALRNPTLPGADGAANLLAAVTVATHTPAAALGPVAVLDDEIHLARWAAKTHTIRTWAIQSPGTGPVGEVAEGRVRLWHAPLFTDVLGLPDSFSGARVDLVRLVAGDDGRLLRSLLLDSPAGVVIEGTGGGHVPSATLDAIDALLERGVPVVLASRCAAGRNLERTYDMPGGEIDIMRRGVLPAGWLSGGKARLRLMVALALGLEPAHTFPVD